MRKIARGTTAMALAAALATGLAACAAPQDGNTDMDIHTHGLAPGEKSKRNEKSDPSMPANLHEATAAELVGRWRLSKSVMDGKEASEGTEGSLELTDDGNGVMVADGHDGSVTWSKGKVVAGVSEMAAFIEREQGDLYLRKGEGWDSYLVFVSPEARRDGDDPVGEASQGSPEPSGQGAAPSAEGQAQLGEDGAVEQLTNPPRTPSGTTLTSLLGTRTEPDKPFTGRWLATAVHGKGDFEYHAYDGLRGITIFPDGKSQMDVAGKVTEGKWSTSDNHITITDGSGGTTLATGALSAGSGIDVSLTEKSGTRLWQDTVHLERG